MNPVFAEAIIGLIIGIIIGFSLGIFVIGYIMRLTVRRILIEEYPTTDTIQRIAERCKVDETYAVGIISIVREELFNRATSRSLT